MTSYGEDAALLNMRRQATNAVVAPGGAGRRAVFGSTITLPTYRADQTDRFIRTGTSVQISSKEKMNSNAVHRRMLADRA